MTLLWASVPDSREVSVVAGGQLHLGRSPQIEPESGTIEVARAASSTSPEKALLPGHPDDGGTWAYYGGVTFCTAGAAFFSRWNRELSSGPNQPKLYC